MAIFTDFKMHWPGGEGDRIPAYARRVVQDPNTLIFNAQVWAPQIPMYGKCLISNDQTSRH